jgi:hypothetical protein
MKKLAMLLIALGSGLLLFGALGFTVYGYDLRPRLEAACGGALLVVGLFLRRDSK